MIAKDHGRRGAVSVVALIAAYNEADIIEQVVAHLIREEVDVYVLDHGSSDDTADLLAPLVGHGVIRIERFPDDGAGTPDDADRFAWESLLRRKETLAREIDADWFIHHDADEFRESPWPQLNLRAAIEKVDRAGYNAIDFELLNFRPVDDTFAAGRDVRETFDYYEPAAPYDRPQIRCWKQADVKVNLASSGGHEAIFPGRCVYPLRFVLRHYPIRSQAHGERKVFHDRLPRFVQDERDRAWHRQYDGLSSGHQFVYDASALTRFEPTAIRLQLALDGIEAMERIVADHERALGAAQDLVATSRVHIEELHAAVAARDNQLRTAAEQHSAVEAALHGRNTDLESTLATRQEQIDDARRDLQAAEADARTLRDEARTLQHEAVQRTAAAQREASMQRERIDALESELTAMRGALHAVWQSKSWRWMGPLRRVYRWLGRA